MKTNPFEIPDLTPMLMAVTAYVKEHQGEKGFILTDNKENDAIYDIEYSQEEHRADEFHVKAVRVKNNTLEILSDLYNVQFDEDYVKSVEDNQWLSVHYSDVVYFIPTIFNIAENIEEYANE